MKWIIGAFDIQNIFLAFGLVHVRRYKTPANRLYGITKELKTFLWGSDPRGLFHTVKSWGHNPDDKIKHLKNHEWCYWAIYSIVPSSIISLSSKILYFPLLFCPDVHNPLLAMHVSSTCKQLTGLGQIDQISEMHSKTCVWRCLGMGSKLTTTLRKHKTYF